MDGPLRRAEHEQIIELLGAYALDAVDADERQLVDDHLGRCPWCRDEVAEHRSAAAMLAQSGAPAPAGLWDRIADALEEAPPPLRLAVTARPSTPPAAGSAPSAGRRRLWPVLMATGAAAAVAVIVGLFVQVLDQRGKLSDLASQAQQADVQRDAAVALGAAGTRTAQLKTDDGAVQAVAVMSADGKGYLLGADLPPVDGKVYQLWGATAPGDVISLGVMHGPGVSPFAGDPSMEAILITVEDHPVESSSNRPALRGGLV
ncbi:MAG: anti-sigma factor domain-containing protein [Acidimicrobiia bacterium]